MANPGAASPARSPLARRDPRVKAIALGVVLLAIGRAFSPASFALIAVVVSAALILARYPARRLLGQVPAIVLLVAVTIVLNGLLVRGEAILSAGPLRVSRLGLVVGATYAAKLVLAVLAMGSFLHATPPLDLVDALGEPRGLPARMGAGWRRTALFLGLALRFLPAMRDEMLRIREGQRARGAGGRGGPLVRARDLVTLIVPLVLWTVSRAREVSYVLDARGFDATRPRTSLIRRRLRPPDAVPLLLPMALYAAVRRLG